MAKRRDSRPVRESGTGPPYPSVSYTQGYVHQKKNPPPSSLLSRAPRQAQCQSMSRTHCAIVHHGGLYEALVPNMFVIHPNVCAPREHSVRYEQGGGLKGSNGNEIRLGQPARHYHFRRER